MKGSTELSTSPKFKETVYVLHAFRKKTQKTAKEDIAAAKRALKQVLKKPS